VHNLIHQHSAGLALVSLRELRIQGAPVFLAIPRLRKWKPIRRVVAETESSG